MKKLLIERWYLPECTEGELFLIDDEYSTISATYAPDNLAVVKRHICWTLELPWKQNTPSISCIPEGSYWMAPHTRPDGRKAFIVWGETVSQAPGGYPDQVGRSGILWHPANKPFELRGCIAPGLDRKPGRLLKSVLGMAALTRAVKEPFSKTDRMVLTIRQKASEAVL